MLIDDQPIYKAFFLPLEPTTVYRIAAAAARQHDATHYCRNNWSKENGLTLFLGKSKGEVCFCWLSMCSSASWGCIHGSALWRFDLSHQLFMVELVTAYSLLACWLYNWLTWAHFDFRRMDRYWSTICLRLFFGTCWCSLSMSDLSLKALDSMHDKCTEIFFDQQLSRNILRPRGTYQHVAYGFSPRQYPQCYVPALHQRQKWQHYIMPIKKLLSILSGIVL